MAGPNVAFLGWQPDEVIRDHFRRCRALLFPGEEDFGIVPVEANACGRAGHRTGNRRAQPRRLRRSIFARLTGVWFEEQQVDSLITAMERFERNRDAFQTATIRKQALRFTKYRYETDLINYLEEAHLAQKLDVRRAAWKSKRPRKVPRVVRRAFADVARLPTHWSGWKARRTRSPAAAAEEANVRVEQTGTLTTVSYGTISV
jgi:hypothetical protein